MSDELDIRHGGVIVVDTAELRCVLEGIRSIGDRAAGVAVMAAGAEQRCQELLARGIDAFWLTAAVQQALARARECDQLIRALAGDLDRALARYELAEAYAAWEFARLRGDSPGAQRAILAGISLARRLGEDDATIARLWSVAEADREEQWRRTQGELQRQAGFGAILAGPLHHLGWVSSLLSAGAVELIQDAIRHVARSHRTNALRPPASSPSGAGLIPGQARPTTAPGSLHEVSERMPGNDTRVRVERYTFADGTQEWVVYVTGTRSAFDPAEPWNMRSNLDMYLAGEHAASSELVDRALADAGVGTEDAVHLVGHSQGAMITGSLALGEGLRVATHITFGSPTTAGVDAGVRSVELRHLDDPVAQLAGAGPAAGAGDPDSIVVTRVADPGVGLGDLRLSSHTMDAYRRTAELVDASDDPRAVALGQLWTHLGSARAVTVTEYGLAASRRS